MRSWIFASLDFVREKAKMLQLPVVYIYIMAIITYMIGMSSSADCYVYARFYSNRAAFGLNYTCNLPHRFIRARGL